MKIEHAMCTNMRFNRINYVVKYIPKLNNLCRYMYIFIAYKYITLKLKQHQMYCLCQNCGGVLISVKLYVFEML